MNVSAIDAERSFLGFFIDALGPGSVLLPLVGLISFVLIAIIVARGRGPMAAAALVLLVPSPLVPGFMLALGGLISSFSIIAQSSVAPKPSELAEGYSMALVAPIAAFFVMIPGLLLAVVGSCIRAFVAESESAARPNPRADGR